MRHATALASKSYIYLAIYIHIYRLYPAVGAVAAVAGKTDWIDTKLLFAFPRQQHEAAL